MIRITSYDQLKMDTISKVCDGKITIPNASKLLNRSIRTIERYLRLHKEKGSLHLLHKNRGRDPINKTADSVRTKVEDLIKIKYFDFNLTHLREKLKSDEGVFINKETLRRWAHEIHHVKMKKKDALNLEKEGSVWHALVSCCRWMVVHINGSEILNLA